MRNRYVRLVHMENQNRLRNQAKKLLTETKDSITQISYQCGFSNSAYFGKVFKKAFGMTPLAYRSMVK